MNQSENYKSGTNQQTGSPGGGRISTVSMVQVAIFGAIICVMAFTPFLGYIPLGFTSVVRPIKIGYSGTIAEN